jgi:hypothetical protein
MTLANIALMFGRSLATVEVETKHICLIVIEALHGEIKWPDGRTRAELATLVPNFPGCIGFIDATCRPIRRPTRHHSLSYRGDKGYNEQVFIVVNPFGEIIFIQYGINGHINDRAAFVNSILYTNRHIYFGDDQYMLGDGGYRGSGPIVCPFSIQENRNSNVHRRFNHALRKERTLVERVFGHVCYNQWGRLRNRWLARKESLGPTMHAACLLSNWLARRRGPLVNLETLAAFSIFIQ